MNLSLQITNPKFLSNDFTTRLDLITGKLYYQSEWGAIFAMLPPDIIEMISQYAWIWVDLYEDIRFSNWKPEPITRPRLEQIRANQTRGQERRFLRYDGEIELRDPYDLWVDLYHHSKGKEQLEVKRGFKGKVMKMIQANENLHHYLKHTFLNEQGNCVPPFYLRASLSSRREGAIKRLRIDGGHGYNWEDPLGEH
jgi:hypothetical protein